MKKILFAAIGIVCLMASCTKDELDQPAVNPNAGQEVKFTSDLDAATRTLYAEEYASSQAVKWVDGDLISVYGASCSVKQAEYKVTATTGTEDTDGDGTADTNYYYAASLTKTGTAGVQWGSEATSDFYAVYPSTENAFELAADGKSATVRTTVRTTQNLTFALNGAGDTWVGTHYATNSSNPTMTDAVMYAYTSGAESTDDAVNLKFKPFSTVLRFTFDGYQGYNSVTNGVYSEPYDSTIAVTRIILTAPNAYVAGDFDLTISADSASASTDNVAVEDKSQQIVIYPDYLPVNNKQKIQFDVFTIPQAHKLPVDEPWTVQLETTSGTFTYQMIPKKVSTGESAEATLTAGKIHKVNVPLMEFQKSGFEIPVENWIRYIPRNVYVTELSYPGAWYATNSSYQNTTSLSEQYKAGVRAFHIDCRLTYKDGNEGDMDLYCAGTEPSFAGSITGEGTTVLSALTDLAALLPAETATAADKDEFIIVVLTVAEFAKTDSDVVLGTVAPAQVLASINSVLSVNASALKLYTSPITANTTVNDVLGKMIVKVNVNAETTAFPTFEFWKSYTSAYAMFSEGSMSALADSSNSINKANFKTMNSPAIYWGNTLIKDPELKYYYHQAQRTYSTNPYTDSSYEVDDEKYLGIPTLDERKAAIDDIIDHSAEIYAQGTHNAWYQLGIGGYVRDRKYVNLYITKYWRDDGDEDWNAVASSLNAYVLEKVNAKLESDPSPVGIVLMNYATTTNADSEIVGSDLVNAVFKMNSMFYLNRDKEAEEWPYGSPFPEIDTTTGDIVTDNGFGDLS